MISKEKFLERAYKKHGDKYNYDKMNYVNYMTPVTITCPIHGDFIMTPRDHASKGYGCQKCGIESRAKKRKDTTEKFVEKAMAVHGNRYDYSKSVYLGTNEDITIICPEHGEFVTTPGRHLNNKNGCPECAKKAISEKLSLGKEEFVKRSTEIHCGKYDYSLSEYVNQDTPVSIICPIHGVFEQKPEYHMCGSQCPECAKVARAMKHFLGTENFVARAREVHGNRYDYSKTVYTGIYDPVTITCPEHGDFTQKANDHLCGCGCQECGRAFSRYENEIYDFLRKVMPEGATIIKNDRIILLGNELDIYIPEKKVAIEFDGLFWHNEINKPDKKYHLAKTEMCEKAGIHLIHIFEDEWIYKQDIVKGRLKSILGLNERIYARKCQIKKLEAREALKFIETHHIQGKVGGSYYYGLIYGDEVVAVMSFGNVRKNLGRERADGTYELLRYCSKTGINVIGGAGRLLSRFIKDVKPLKIISYADRRWSVGNLYEKLGFAFIRNTDPSYYYVFNDKRKNRFAFRKDVLIKKYGCSKDETEHSFCLKNRWYRIYDCGTKLYEMNIKNV